MTMGLLSANDLASCRATQSESFDKTCAVIHYTRTTTTSGGQSASSTSTETVCRARPGGAPTRGNDGGKVTDKMQWTISLPYDTTISAGDDITIGTQTFRVVGFPDDQSFLTALTIRCIEV